ncbi:MAG TPA: hypothetical protein VKV80_06160 [Streptosporangiaceae bacterium]|nr:hypothetical protein [Streptosporangiaceae bacterium]
MPAFRCRRAGGHAGLELPGRAGMVAVRIAGLGIPARAAWAGTGGRR